MRTAFLQITLLIMFATVKVQAQEVGKVISSTPVIQQVAVTRQVCNNQQVVSERPKSGAGAAMGAIAGGAIGTQIGGGALGAPWPPWRASWGALYWATKSKAQVPQKHVTCTVVTRKCSTRTALLRTACFMNTPASNTPCKCHKTQARQYDYKSHRLLLFLQLQVTQCRPQDQLLINDFKTSIRHRLKNIIKIGIIILDKWFKYAQPFGCG